MLWNKLIRFGFRLLYNEMAWSYDAVSWLASLGAWQDWQRAALPFITGERVLEIGHGPGHMLLALQQARYAVVGLDLSPYMGQMARRRASVPLVRGRVQGMPLATAVFDTVLSTFPTDYIIQPQTLAAVYRVLRGNGRFVIVPEGHLTGTGPLYGFIEWLFQITGQRRGPFTVNEAGNWPHETAWQSFKQLFIDAGFQVDIEQIELANSIVTVIIAQKHN